MPSILTDISNKFLAAVEDLTTIEVQTFTGKVTGNAIEWDKFKPGPDSIVRLVAATRIDADLDAMNFRAEDAADLPPDLLELHQAAVKTAVEARTAFVKMVLTAIKG